VSATATTRPDPSSATTRLSRSAVPDRERAPVRIAHLGLGNFSRAHQAWYTDRVPDAGRWGIAAFTGRSPSLAEALAPQDGLFTLVTRARDGDRFDVVGSLSAVHPASDHAAWLRYLRSAELAVVTLTVTEAGYCRGADGSLDTGRADVRDDVAALRSDPGATVQTMPGRLVAGLLARRSAAAGPIAVVPCDNLPQNGAVTARVVRELASAVDPTLVPWIDDSVSFVTTMVDRITPRTVDADRDAVLAATGLSDEAPVVTEPFSEWVLSGEFPAGRPDWPAAGARVVDDVAPFEERKLWLLNGAHSLLAYGGTLRGHETVADAVADPVCRGWITEWWDEAQQHLELPAASVEPYRAALLERFANPGIRHQLAQIAADGSQKLAVRILPVLRAERAAGRVPPGATRALAAWVCHLRGEGAPLRDPAADELARLAGGPLEAAVVAVLGFLDPDLAHDGVLVAATARSAEELVRR
jgi:fructuronate reductase